MVSTLTTGLDTSSAEEMNGISLQTMDTRVPSCICWLREEEGEVGGGGAEDGLRTSIWEVWRLQGEASRKGLESGPTGL